MYTLLLVDDASYTRQGILKALPLQQLQITKVIEAEDGIDALRRIHLETPDIILTDVKMPRMDGIEMSLNIRKKHPNCIIIFMSGYSEQSFLRSAIKLRAIHYVDKPIDMDEIINVLQEAVLLCAKQNETLEIIDNHTQHQLLLALTKSKADTNEVNLSLKLINIDAKKVTNALTFIIKLLPEPDIEDELLYHMQQSYLSIVDLFLSGYPLAYLRTFKDSHTLVCHLLQIDKTINLSSKTWQKAIFSKLSTNLNHYKHFIAVGIPVKNYLSLNHSYTSAIISLHQNFFIGVNSTSYSNYLPLKKYSFPPKSLLQFEKCITNKDKLQALNIVNLLSQTYQKHTGTTIPQVKLDYFKFILHLHTEDENLIWNALTNAYTLSELDCFVKDYIEAYFKTLEVQSDKRQISTAIYDFIHMNYSNNDFTIDMMSQALNLTSTYLSYIFKQETGETINHYLTQYRIKQAKQHLPNMSYKISNIGAMVGYGDNNYFAKVFKRTTGTSPSEFRRIVCSS